MHSVIRGLKPSNCISKNYDLGVNIPLGHAETIKVVFLTEVEIPDGHLENVLHFQTGRWR